VGGPCPPGPIAGYGPDSSTKIMQSHFLV